MGEEAISIDLTKASVSEHPTGIRDIYVDLTEKDNFFLWSDGSESSDEEEFITENDVLKVDHEYLEVNSSNSSTDSEATICNPILSQLKNFDNGDNMSLWDNLV